MGRLWPNEKTFMGLKFANKALRNFDLMDRVKRLGIKNFRGIYSRDNLPQKIMKKDVGIINLDTKIGVDTHWIAYRNIDPKHTEYFDSFGLKMPSEVTNYLNKSGKPLVFSGDEIQERCSLWILVPLLLIGKTTREKHIRDHT